MALTCPVEFDVATLRSEIRGLYPALSQSQAVRKADEHHRVSAMESTVPRRTGYRRASTAAILRR